MKKFTILLILLTSFTLLLQAQPGGNRSWSILQSWDIPGKASGLAWDGTYFYFGIYGSDGDHFYQFDPSTGGIQLAFTVPSVGDCFGMTYDGNNLWLVNQVSPSSSSAQATEVNMSGTVLSTFNLPDHYMSGIAFDNGDFWVGTYYPDPGTVYQVDNVGSIQTQFTPPADQIWDICKDGSYLWMCDYDANMIYKTDQSGNVIESHPSENIKPSGIVYDGTYLWYVDGQLSTNSKLYKVSLTGSGTPEIIIPVEYHDFGAVTITTTETWMMEVQNTGNTNLEITNLGFSSSSPFSTSMSMPQTIIPGGSLDIPVDFSPVTTGHFQDVISVESSDPINPVVEVEVEGDGVNSGPSIFVPEDMYDYSDVRVHAFTRWFMTIVNIGDADLLVSNIASENEAFIIDESVEYPLSLSPLDTVYVGVWFNPSEDVTYYGKLSIENNDPTQNPYSVSLQGYGLDIEYPIGDALWTYDITTGYDPSPKAITPIFDITGDGVSDVIVCSEDNRVRCLNGNSSGTADLMWYKEIYSGNVYDQAGLTTMNDIDGDTYDDVVIGTAGGDRSVIVLSGKTGNQIWKFRTSQSGLYGQGGWVYDVDVSHDFNNDGINDVLAVAGDDSEDLGPKRVFCINSYDGISLWNTPLGGAGFSVIGVEDFTGDKKPDVIAGATSADELEGKIFGIDGTDGSIEWIRTVTGSSVWALLQLEDINNDGVKDIAAGDFSGNFYYIDPVTNSVIEQGSVYGALLLRFENMGDVNNDGFSDILVEHSKTNGIVLNGEDASTVWLTPLADKSFSVSVIDDINDDGINDALIGTLYTDNNAYFIDGSNGDILETIPYGAPVDAISSIPDIVGDLSMEMVVGGREGLVSCFSGGRGLITSSDELIANELTNNIVQTYPNPFSNEIVIDFFLNNETVVDITVSDINGKKIAVVLREKCISGNNTCVWNGTNYNGKIVPKGIYILNISTVNMNISKKIFKF